MSGRLRLRVPEPVIVRQVTGQPTVASLGLLERHPVGPFPAEGLNEALGFAVGAGRVGPGADVLEVQGLASLGIAAKQVSRTVIRHDLPALHAVAGVPSLYMTYKADGRALLLVCEHLHVGEARRVINGHVETVNADASRAALLAVALTRWPTLRKRASHLYAQRRPIPSSAASSYSDRCYPGVRNQSQPAPLRQACIRACINGA